MFIVKSNNKFILSKKAWRNKENNVIIKYDLEKIMDLFKKIEIVPYDLNWSEVFEKEKEHISRALGANFVAIHHIGSTSVPGVYSKPKIDIIAVAKDRKLAISDMKKLGYNFRGEWNIPLKCGFTKRDGVNVDVNLHMYFDENHPEIELNIAFRDYLRTHSDVRDEYSKLKKEILADGSSHQRVGKFSFPVYTIRKRAFIDNIFRTIGYNRLRVLKCLTEKEQEAANIFRRKNSEKTADFEDESHEHFVLYRGVEIIGYSCINITAGFNYEIFVDTTEEDKVFLENIVKQWIDAYRD